MSLSTGIKQKSQLWSTYQRQKIASIGVNRNLFPLSHKHQLRNKVTSSTSAIAYKAAHRRRALPLPTIAPPQWSASEAVTNIIYNTPEPPRTPPKRHVLNCLVQNEPGVLARVSGILAARGFNIDSLVVCNTEVRDLSRMTIVLQGQDGVIEQARRQLEDLVPVWVVLDYTQTQIVERELLLAKVSILGPEHFQGLLAHNRADDVAVAGEEESTYHPRSLAPSEGLRHKHEHLGAISRLAKEFGGKILDIADDSCIVELSAKPSRIDSFMRLMHPFGILESSRTGMTALPRTPLHEPHAEETEKDADQLADTVDHSMLPPG